jgi:hypothetical protein
MREARGTMTDIASTLERLRRDGLKRELCVTDSAQGPRVTLDGTCCAQTTISASAGHPTLRAAAAVRGRGGGG